MTCKLARQLVEIVILPVKNEQDFHPKSEILVWSSAKRLYSQRVAKNAKRQVFGGF